MRKPLAYYIKIDPTIEGPFVLVMHRPKNLWEIRGQDAQQYTNWYVSFNGNSKQRRQQQRKLIRDLNQ